MAEMTPEQLQAILGLIGASNGFAAAQAANQMNFQERMSNTAYQRMVRDLKAAGLNPVLAANNGGASTPIGASANADTTGASAVAQLLATTMNNENNLAVASINHATAVDAAKMTGEYNLKMHAADNANKLALEAMEQEFDVDHPKTWPSAIVEVANKLSKLIFNHGRRSDVPARRQMVQDGTNTFLGSPVSKLLAQPYAWQTNSVKMAEEYLQDIIGKNR